MEWDTNRSTIPDTSTLPFRGKVKTDLHAWMVSHQKTDTELYLYKDLFAQQSAKNTTIF